MYQKTEGFLVLYLLRCFGGEGSLSISRIHTQMLRMYGVFTYIRWKKGHIQREMEVNIPYIGVHLGIQLTPLKFNMVHLKIKSLEVWWFRIWFKPSFSGEACWISGEYIFKKNGIMRILKFALQTYQYEVHLGYSLHFKRGELPCIMLNGFLPSSCCLIGKGSICSLRNAKSSWTWGGTYHDRRGFGAVAVAGGFVFFSKNR